MKKLLQFGVAVMCGWATLGVVCSGQEPSDSGRDEAAIRRTDAAWLRAISAKELEATVSFYDERGSLFVPNAPIATGRAEIRTMWMQLFAMPGFTLTAKAAKVEVARSGDLAYSQGTYDFAASPPGKPAIADHGKYVIVWKKQADGSWKVTADIFNSDLPVAETAK